MKQDPNDPHIADEFAGQGGSYVIDPATGVRTLMHRTEPAKPRSAPEAAADAPADPNQSEE